MTRVTISTHGPLFDGRAQHDLEEFARHTEEKIANDAVSRLRAYLPTVYDKDPWTATGYYTSRISTERQVNDMLVTDDRVIYGPWLEGTGSEDFPVTRFRGYHAFRKISQQLDAEARGISEEELQPYLERINHG